MFHPPFLFFFFLSYYSFSSFSFSFSFLFVSARLSPFHVSLPGLDQQKDCRSLPLDNTQHHDDDDNNASINDHHPYLFQEQTVMVDLLRNQTDHLHFHIDNNDHLAAHILHSSSSSIFLNGLIIPISIHPNHWKAVGTVQIVNPFMDNIQEQEDLPSSSKEENDDDKYVIDLSDALQILTHVGPLYQAHALMVGFPTNQTTQHTSDIYHGCKLFKATSGIYPAAMLLRPSHMRYLYEKLSVETVFVIISSWQHTTSLSIAVTLQSPPEPEIPIQCQREHNERMAGTSYMSCGGVSGLLHPHRMARFALDLAALRDSFSPSEQGIEIELTMTTPFQFVDVYAAAAWDCMPESVLLKVHEGSEGMCGHRDNLFAAVSVGTSLALFSDNEIGSKVHILLNSVRHVEFLINVSFPRTQMMVSLEETVTLLVRDASHPRFVWFYVPPTNAGHQDLVPRNFPEDWTKHAPAFDINVSAVASAPPELLLASERVGLHLTSDLDEHEALEKGILRVSAEDTWTTVRVDRNSPARKDNPTGWYVLKLDAVFGYSKVFLTVSIEGAEHDTMIWRTLYTSQTLAAEWKSVENHYAYWMHYQLGGKPRGLRLQFKQVSVESGTEICFVYCGPRVGRFEMCRNMPFGVDTCENSRDRHAFAVPISTETDEVNTFIVPKDLLRESSFYGIRLLERRGINTDNTSENIENEKNDIVNSGHHELGSGSASRMFVFQVLGGSIYDEEDNGLQRISRISSGIAVRGMLSYDWKSRKGVTQKTYYFFAADEIEKYLTRFNHDPNDDMFSVKVILAKEAGSISMSWQCGTGRTSMWTYSDVNTFRDVFSYSRKSLVENEKTCLLTSDRDTQLPFGCMPCKLEVWISQKVLKQKPQEKGQTDLAQEAERSGGVGEDEKNKSEKENENEKDHDEPKESGSFILHCRYSFSVVLFPTNKRKDETGDERLQDLMTSIIQPQDGVPYMGVLNVPRLPSSSPLDKTNEILSSAKMDEANPFSDIFLFHANSWEPEEKLSFVLTSLDGLPLRMCIDLLDIGGGNAGQWSPPTGNSGSEKADVDRRPRGCRWPRRSERSGMYPSPPIITLYAKGEENSTGWSETNSGTDTKGAETQENKKGEQEKGGDEQKNEDKEETLVRHNSPGVESGILVNSEKRYIHHYHKHNPYKTAFVITVEYDMNKLKSKYATRREKGSVIRYSLLVSTNPNYIPILEGVPVNIRMGKGEVRVLRFGVIEIDKEVLINVIGNAGVRASFDPALLEHSEAFRQVTTLPLGTSGTSLVVPVNDKERARFCHTAENLECALYVSVDARVFADVVVEVDMNDSFPVNIYRKTPLSGSLKTGGRKIYYLEELDSAEKIHISLQLSLGDADIVVVLLPAPVGMSRVDPVSTTEANWLSMEMGDDLLSISTSQLKSAAKTAKCRFEDQDHSKAEKCILLVQVNACSTSRFTLVVQTSLEDVVPFFLIADGVSFHAKIMPTEELIRFSYPLHQYAETSPSILGFFIHHSTCELAIHLNVPESPIDIPWPESLNARRLVSLPTDNDGLMIDLTRTDAIRNICYFEFLVLMEVHAPLVPYIHLTLGGLPCTYTSDVTPKYFVINTLRTSHETLQIQVRASHGRVDCRFVSASEITKKLLSPHIEEWREANTALQQLRATVGDDGKPDGKAFIGFTGDGWGSPSGTDDGFPLSSSAALDTYTKGNVLSVCGVALQNKKKGLLRRDDICQAILIVAAVGKPIIPENGSSSSSSPSSSSHDSLSSPSSSHRAVFTVSVWNRSTNAVYLAGVGQPLELTPELWDTKSREARVAIPLTNAGNDTTLNLYSNYSSLVSSMYVFSTREQLFGEKKCSPGFWTTNIVGSAREPPKCWKGMWVKTGDEKVLSVTIKARDMGLSQKGILYVIITLKSKQDDADPVETVVQIPQFFTCLLSATESSTYNTLLDNDLPLQYIVPPRGVLRFGYESSFAGGFVIFVADPKFSPSLLRSAKEASYRTFLTEKLSKLEMSVSSCNSTTYTTEDWRVDVTPDKFGYINERDELVSLIRNHWHVSNLLCFYRMSLKSNLDEEITVSVYVSTIQDNFANRLSVGVAAFGALVSESVLDVSSGSHHRGISVSLYDLWDATGGTKSPEAMLLLRYENCVGTVTLRWAQERNRITNSWRLNQNATMRDVMLRVKPSSVSYLSASLYRLCAKTGDYRCAPGDELDMVSKLGVYTISLSPLASSFCFRAIRSTTVSLAYLSLSWRDYLWGTALQQRTVRVSWEPLAVGEAADVINHNLGKPLELSEVNPDIRNDSCGDRTQPLNEDEVGSPDSPWRLADTEDVVYEVFFSPSTASKGNWDTSCGMYHDWICGLEQERREQEQDKYMVESKRVNGVGERVGDTSTAKPSTILVKKGYLFFDIQNLEVGKSYNFGVVAKYLPVHLSDKKPQPYAYNHLNIVIASIAEFRGRPTMGGSPTSVLTLLTLTLSTILVLFVVLMTVPTMYKMLRNMQLLRKHWEMASWKENEREEEEMEEQERGEEDNGGKERRDRGSKKIGQKEENEEIRTNERTFVTRGGEELRSPFYETTSVDRRRRDQGYATRSNRSSSRNNESPYRGGFFTSLTSMLFRRDGPSEFTETAAVVGRTFVNDPSFLGVGEEESNKRGLGSESDKNREWDHESGGFRNESEGFGEERGGLSTNRIPRVLQRIRKSPTSPHNNGSSSQLTDTRRNFPYFTLDSRHANASCSIGKSAHNDDYYEEKEDTEK